MKLSGLYLYPVKSLRGISVSRANVDLLGLEGDRRFMVVDPTGRFLTQRTVPRMALVSTALSNGTLSLSAETAGEIEIRTRPDPTAPLRNVSVWKSEGLLAEDCGDVVAAWLSDFLHTACRLVRIGPKFQRPVLKADVAGPGDRVTFADSCPFLIVGEASLNDLNDRLVGQGEEVVPMNRFRPNLVVAGSLAFAEDTWPRFRVGAITFHSAGPCTRCSITTTDQLTAVRGKEPLRTLAQFRRDPRDPAEVNFGQNLVHETKSGILQVGDEVELVA
jgi:uncharacterized protein